MLRLKTLLPMMEIAGLEVRCSNCKHWQFFYKSNQSDNGTDDGKRKCGHPGNKEDKKGRALYTPASYRCDAHEPLVPTGLCQETGS